MRAVAFKEGIKLLNSGKWKLYHEREIDIENYLNESKRGEIWIFYENDLFFMTGVEIRPKSIHIATEKRLKQIAIEGEKVEKYWTTLQDLMFRTGTRNRKKLILDSSRSRTKSIPLRLVFTSNGEMLDTVVDYEISDLPEIGMTIRLNRSKWTLRYLERLD